MKKTKRSIIWEDIFNRLDLHNFNFEKDSYSITSDEVRNLTLDYSGSAKEPRILCRHITPKEQPDIFVEKQLFTIPVKNKEYRIIKGNPFTKVPHIETDTKQFKSKMNFKPVCTDIGDSEMQHLDFCYHAGLLNEFCNIKSPLFQTLRGRKYSKKFNFHVGNIPIEVDSVQYETDAVYESEDEIIIVEAKNHSVDYINNRQFFYPFRDILNYAKGKRIRLLLFCHHLGCYSFWEFNIDNKDDFNSLNYVKSAKYNLFI